MIEIIDHGDTIEVPSMRLGARRLQVHARPGKWIVVRTRGRMTEGDLLHKPVYEGAMLHIFEKANVKRGGKGLGRHLMSFPVRAESE